MMDTFIMNRKVQASEIDQLNHVNNVVYIEWMQDIAHLHWAVLTKENPQDNFAWMVIRHEVDYKNQAILGDEITVKTWVGETSGVKSIRHVEIFRGDVLLAKAQTTFCLLNAKTLRPTRISETIINILKPSK